MCLFKNLSETMIPLANKLEVLQVELRPLRPKSLGHAEKAGED
jgi:hypothetical protein